MELNADIIDHITTDNNINFDIYGPLMLKRLKERELVPVDASIDNVKWKNRLLMDYQGNYYTAIIVSSTGEAYVANNDEYDKTLNSEFKLFDKPKPIFRLMNTGFIDSDGKYWTMGNDSKFQVDDEMSIIIDKYDIIELFKYGVIHYGLRRNGKIISIKMIPSFIDEHSYSITEYNGIKRLILTYNNKYEITTEGQVIDEKGRTIDNLSNVVDMSTNGRHVIALTKHGHVWEWDVGFVAPTRVDGLQNIVAIISIQISNYALDKHGHVWSWYGDVPTKLKLKNIVAIHGLRFHSGIIAIEKSGANIQLWSWGKNGAVLGLGNIKNSNIPRKVSLLIS